MAFLLLKNLHILSAFLLFGTGLGSAFYKWMADRSRNIEHITIVNHHVVLADWIFTTPTIIIQPITGIWLAWLAGFPLTSTWLVISIALYIFAGMCWLPVVYLQIRMKKLSKAAFLANEPLPDQYWFYARIWFYLGIPAFIAMIIVVFLMVTKGMVL